MGALRSNDLLSIKVGVSCFGVHYHWGALPQLKHTNQKKGIIKRWLQATISCCYSWLDSASAATRWFLEFTKYKSHAGHVLHTASWLTEVKQLASHLPFLKMQWMFLILMWIWKGSTTETSLGFIITHDIIVGGYMPALVFLTLGLRTVIENCFE